MNLQACVQRQGLCAVCAALEGTQDVFMCLIVKEPSELAHAELLMPVVLQVRSYSVCVYLCGMNCCGWHVCQPNKKLYFGMRLIFFHH